MTTRSARPLKYPWAVLGDRFVHIAMIEDGDVRSEIDDGLHFRCPSRSCGRRMVTRAVGSTERRPHFSHLPGEDCGFNPETVVHMAAKAFLSERPEMLLALLRIHPHDGGSRIVEEARYARWRATSEEETILGRWRADIVMRDEITDQIRGDVAMPFMIIEEDGLPPLVVEVVVTSRVEPAKIAAVQAAGWRMLEIRLGPDGAGSRDIGALVRSGAGRRWLAHPVWAPAFAAMKVEAERRDAERRQRADVHIRRVQDRIMQGRNLIHWDPMGITALTVCAHDNALHPHVVVDNPHQHWMAAAREWWRIDLLRQAVFSEIQAGDESPILPEPEYALGLVEGYVLKLPADPRRAVLDDMGIDRAGWGTPLDAVAAFLDSLVETGFAEVEDGIRHVTPYHVALARRHHEIDRLLLPVYHLTLTAPDAYRMLLNWKNGAPAAGAPSRRAIVSEGGSGYLALLEAAQQLHRRKFGEQEVDHDHEERTTMREAPRSHIPVPGPAADGPEYLGAVHQVRSETHLVDTEGSDDVVAVVAAETPSAIAEADPVDPDLVTELAEKARARFKDRDEGKTEMKVALFMGTGHPALHGRRPREHCTSRDALKECVALLRRGAR